MYSTEFFLLKQKELNENQRKFEETIVLNVVANNKFELNMGAVWIKGK